MTKGTIIKLRNAIFFGDIYTCKKKDDEQTAVSYRKRTRDEGISSHPIKEEQRPSKRGKIANNLGPDFITFMLEEEPSTVSEALSGSDVAI